MTVEQQLISSIGKGVLVFAAVAPGDTRKDAEALARKVLKMKLWEAEDGTRVGEIDIPLAPSRQETLLTHCLLVTSGNGAFKTLTVRSCVVRTRYGQ